MSTTADVPLPADEVQAQSEHVPLGWPERITVDQVAAMVRAPGRRGLRDGRAGGQSLADERDGGADRRAAGARRREPDGGAALFLSHHTVQNHVLHILTKLDVESRPAAAAWAVRHGLG